MDRSFSQFYFAQEEHPTSVKFNNILSTMDKCRYLSGPISVSACASGTFDANDYVLQLDDSPHDVGGIMISGATYITRESFMVYYEIENVDPTDFTKYARWENIHFASGDSDWNYQWYADLGSLAIASGILGDAANQVNLSSANISSFKCVREPMATGHIYWD